MKVLGPLILTLGFAFPVLGQEQVITCGPLLDRAFILEYCQGENPREEECGLRINDDERFSPWFELSEKADDSEYSIAFVDGLANLFRFDPDQAELIRLHFANNNLIIELNAYSGHHGRTVLLAMNLFRRPARELDGFFYQGTMNIILNYENIRSLATPQALTTHMAAEVYRMPFVCVTESSQI